MSLRGNADGNADAAPGGNGSILFLGAPLQIRDANRRHDEGRRDKQVGAAMPCPMDLEEGLSPHNPLHKAHWQGGLRIMV